MSAEEKKTLKMINFKCHIDICGEPYLLAAGLDELKVNNYVEFREGNYRYFKDISCIFFQFLSYNLSEAKQNVGHVSMETL